MKYGAITLDTSIFDKNGLKLESGLLKALEQFKGKPAALILSEIVLKELLSHLTKKVSDTRAQLERALQDSSDYLNLDSTTLGNVKKSIPPTDKSKDFAKEKIRDFFDRTGAHMIKVEPYIEVSDLINRYFHATPPFSESGRKKSEFPDAMALLSLEAYAKEKRIKILAVSTDSDWIEFAKYSEWIVVVGDLAEGIAAFQPQEFVFDFCKKLGIALVNGQAKKVCLSLESYLSTAVSEINPNPDAESPFFWDADSIEVEFKDFSIVEDEADIPLLHPIQTHDGGVSIEAKITVQASAYGEFSLSVYDSIDKDRLSMGLATKTVDIEFETELLFTVVGDLDGNLEDLEVNSVEILSFPRFINFGTLEPDWWHDENG